LALPDQKGRGKDLCKEPKQEEHSDMPLGSSTQHTSSTTHFSNRNEWESATIQRVNNPFGYNIDYNIGYNISSNLRLFKDVTEKF